MNPPKIGLALVLVSLSACSIMFDPTYLGRGVSVDLGPGADAADDAAPIESADGAPVAAYDAATGDGTPGTRDSPAGMDSPRPLDAPDEALGDGPGRDAVVEAAADTGRDAPPVDAAPGSGDAPSDARGGADAEGGPPDPALVGYWSFDEGSGTSAGDGSGRGHTAALVGGATWGAGKVGSHALLLPSAGGFADVPSAVLDTSKPYTVTAWFESTAPTNDNQCVAAIEGNAASGFYFMLNNNGHYQLTLPSSDALSPPTWSVAASNASIAPMVWHHYAGVFDGSRTYLYVDGAVNESLAVPPPWAAPGHTVIGRSKFGAATNFVVGSIDELRMYARALAPAEIQALYALH